MVHNCRSTVVALRPADAKRRGITETLPDSPPQEGFGYSPPVQWQPTLEGFPAALVEAYREKLKAEKDKKERRKPKEPAPKQPKAPPKPKTIADTIPPGKRVKGKGYDDASGSLRFFDYSHALSPANRAEGYTAELRDYQDAALPNLRGLRTAIFDKRGLMVGQVAGSIRKISGKPLAINIGLADVSKDHEHKRLGQAAYEAAIAHSVHAHGVTHVRGDEHSTLADAAHRRMAEKYGWDYRAELVPGRENAKQGAYDGRYGPYEYEVAKRRRKPRRKK